MRWILIFFALLSSDSFSLGNINPDRYEFSLSDGSIFAQVEWVKGPYLAEESILRVEWKGAFKLLPMDPPGEFEIVLWMRPICVPLDSEIKPVVVQRVNKVVY